MHSVYCNLLLRVSVAIIFIRRHLTLFALKLWGFYADNKATQLPNETVSEGKSWNNK